MKCALCKGRGELLLRAKNFRSIKCAPCKGTGVVPEVEEKAVG